MAGDTVHWYLQCPETYGMVLDEITLRAKNGAPTSALGTYLLTGTKTGAVNVLGAANFNLETLADDVPANVALSATFANRVLADGEEVDFSFASNNADLTGDYIIITVGYRTRG